MKQIYQLDSVVRPSFLCRIPLPYAAVEYFFEFIFSRCYIVACEANVAERAYNGSGEMACGLIIIGVVV
jgi:hypothetical protein